ncbi:MAG: MaoC family dehydratase N-terminal domain-containing protein [Xanthobacteraceae bacterium]
MLLTLSDFSAGQVYKSGPYVVSNDDVTGFFEVLGHSPETLSLFEHGTFKQWLVSSLTMRLIASGEIQVSGGTVDLGVDNLEWRVPIQPDDTLVVESKVLEVHESRSNARFGIVTMLSTTINQHGEIVQTCTHSVRVAKRDT